MAAMTERHLIAYAILLFFLMSAGFIWRLRRRRARRAPKRHLRIDLLPETAEEAAVGEP
jgi:hypothetical protein